MIPKISINPNTNLRQKDLIRLGEQMLHEVNSEFPVIHSYTRLKSRIGKVENLPEYQQIAGGMKNILKRFFINILKTHEYCADLHYCKDANPGGKLEQMLKEHPYADCAEMMTLLYYRLKKIGLPFKAIRWEVRDVGDTPIDRHYFILTGFKKGAQGSRPKTWGDAVVMDAWSNFVLPYQKAFAIYENGLPNDKYLKLHLKEEILG